MTTLDYKSEDVLSKRLGAVFEKFCEKTKSECNVGDLRRAVVVLVSLVTTNPSFIKRKLKNLEKLIFNDKAESDVKRPTLVELEVLLSHWYELANLAYEPKTAIIFSKLKDFGYVCIHHSQSTEPGVVSYFMAFNPEKKEFLVGVKGTGTTEDLLTDAMAATMPYKPDPLCPFTAIPAELRAALADAPAVLTAALAAVPTGITTAFANMGRKDHDNRSAGSGSGSGSGSHGNVREVGAHEGMLAAALRLKEAVDPFLEHCYIPLGYSVRIVGHSLGAGTSSLLALLLRTQYKELHAKGRLHAYCFATPPVMDLESAVSSKEFITTIANRSDCVVRLSMGNAEVLVRTLENMIPLMEREGLTNLWGCVMTALGGKNEITDEEFEKFVKVVEEAQASVDASNQENLSVPGKVIALYGTLDDIPEKDEDIDKKVVVKAAEIACDNPFLRFIDINSRMISDHLLDQPGGYKESLQACIKSMQST